MKSKNNTLFLTEARKVKEEWILEVQNYALTQKNVLISIAVVKFSENSQEKCLLGCWFTNACKWVYNIFASKFADCNGIDITRLYILSPGYASYSPGYTSYSEQECAVLRGVTGKSCD